MIFYRIRNAAVGGGLVVFELGIWSHNLVQLAAGLAVTALAVAAAAWFIRGQGQHRHRRGHVVPLRHPHREPTHYPASIPDAGNDGGRRAAADGGVAMLSYLARLFGLFVVVGAAWALPAPAVVRGLAVAAYAYPAFRRELTA